MRDLRKHLIGLLLSRQGSLQQLPTMLYSTFHGCSSYLDLNDLPIESWRMSSPVYLSARQRVLYHSEVVNSLCAVCFYSRRTRKLSRRRRAGGGARARWKTYGAASRGGKFENKDSLGLNAIRVGCTLVVLHEHNRLNPFHITARSVIPFHPNSTKRNKETLRGNIWLAKTFIAE